MQRFVLFAAAALLTGGAHASPVLQISLANAVLVGTPGSTVEWFADLSDPIDLTAGNSMAVTGSSFDVPCQGCIPPPATKGIYTDSVGAIFLVLSPSGNCCGDPQSVLGQPIGTFIISPSATLGSISGFLEIDYSIFSTDPNDPNFNPDTQTVNPDVRAFAPVTLEVVPEPGTLAPALIGISAGLAFALLRLRGRGRLPRASRLR